MRVKSAYRLKKESTEEMKIPADPNIPEIKIDGEKPDHIAAIHHESDQPPSEAVAEAMAKASTADEATARLKAELERLRTAEQLQRQHAQMASMQRPVPPDREARLATWRQLGLSESDAAFLRQHGDLIDHPHLCRTASGLAAQEGHAPDSDAHREATLRHFRSLQAQAQPALEPPQLFQAPPPPPPEPSRASIVSAPVSRGEIGGYREPSPSSVRLSGEEREIARASGISEVEYAKHKLAMLRKQRAGEIQN
jgi:hypothetical protein